MIKLVVISGLPCSGKYPLARRLCDEDKELVLVHRDTFRDALTNLSDEWALSLTTAAIARQLLRSGLSVCICGWNSEPCDRELWNLVAFQTKAIYSWLDTGEPDVARMIPRLEGWTPAALTKAAHR